MVFFCKRRKEKANDSKPGIKSATSSQFANPVYECRATQPGEFFDNPTYEVGEQQPRNRAENNDYSLVDEPGHAACSEDKQDLPGQLYDYIEDVQNKNLLEDFADEAIYENVARSSGENSHLSFTNPCFQ